MTQIGARLSLEEGFQDRPIVVRLYLLVSALINGWLPAFSEGA